ncbi:hypothetical protein C0Q70_12242 [Pomacea canaliculata]|uniref:Receptor protein-tyrosine kinase n=1 Tax=Pomacea canaliculata TaxID=400727 RepID=A0A2T7P0Y7_POMCA|nr:fibroblast growth factor receptor 1-like isoform X5 [Pomacea canaliculata]PVD27091.1 hypothetical protein C0Q70_12242 [Pomacea canaliculata]
MRIRYFGAEDNRRNADEQQQIERCRHNTMALSTAFMLVALTSRVLASDLVKIQGPSDNAIIVGNNVELFCLVYTTDENGVQQKVTQPYNVTWYFKPEGVNVSRVVLEFISDGQSANSVSFDSSKYKAAEVARLQILAISLGDAGLYTCHLDASGQPSTGYGAHLMVIDTPACHNQNPESFSEQNITLDCIINFRGYRMPIVDWRLGTLKLNSTTEVLKNKSVLIETLTLTATEQMNGYVYHCHVEYPGLAQIECMAHPSLRVYKAAQIMSVVVSSSSGQESSRIAPGAKVRMQCSAQGYPVPQYTWYFRPRGSSSMPRKLAIQDYYEIPSFQATDEGMYYCYAINEINTRVFRDSRNLTLQLQEVEYNQQYNVGGQAWSASSAGGELQAQESDSGIQFSPYAVGALISAGLAVLLIIVFVVLAMRLKRERKIREKLARAHDETLDDQEVELLDEGLQPNGHFLPAEYSRLKMSWEIPRKDIRLLEQIGRGSFVEVWKGRMRRTPGTNDIVRIIVKKLDAEATNKERHFFSTELEVMKMVPSHPNIVRLIGSYTSNEPWLTMLEVAQEGTLQEFLQRHRPGQQEIVIGRGDDQPVFMRKHTLTAQKLLCLAAQVASGLEHLQKFKLIYYRLQSARVLVAKGGVCKLSGFGFPHEIGDRNMYQQASAPIRWMAPESLVENVYNTKTDVWSYGVLVWEILHFGMTPWPRLGPQEVLESVHTGKRMPPPPHCSKIIYGLMMKCWMANPEDRPTYDAILESLSHMVTEAEAHVVYAHLPAYLQSLDGGADGDADGISHA